MIAKATSLVWSDSLSVHICILYNFGNVDTNCFLFYTTKGRLFLNQKEKPALCGRNPISRPGTYAISAGIQFRPVAIKNHNGLRSGGHGKVHLRFVFYFLYRDFDKAVKRL